MGKPIHECKREYTENDAYADYGRLLALRDLRINHSELADDEWCNDYFMAVDRKRHV